MSFDKNINQVKEIFNSIFTDLDFTKSFVRRFLKERDYSFLDEYVQANIKKATSLLVSNAMDTETRKMQQQYFMVVLQELDNDNFLTKFDEDHELRIKFLELLVVFFDKNNFTDATNAHHVGIVKMIEEKAKKI